MKKLLLVFLVMILSSGVAFAGGDKNRGDNGTGTVVQDLCGPNDECAGTPYWWL